MHAPETGLRSLARLGCGVYHSLKLVIESVREFALPARTNHLDGRQRQPAALTQTQLSAKTGYNPSPRKPKIPIISADLEIPYIGLLALSFDEGWSF